MSTSRRRFLKAGAFAAVFAALPLRSVIAQDWKSRDGNPVEEPAAQADLLSYYSKASFKSYLNSVFQIHSVFGIVEVTLLQVTDMPAPRNGECFSLLFRGGSRPLRQDTYVLVHPSLGTFSLLLVPTGSDRNGAQGYLATINRLSYADTLANPAPTRSRFQPGTTAPMPATTPTAPAAPVPTPTPTPTVSEPVVVPIIVAPVQQPTVEPKPKRKPKRRKKPSLKETDQRIFR